MPMDGEKEQYVYLYRSEDEWLLSLVVLDDHEPEPNIGRVSFRQPISPAVAKWLKRELRGGVLVEVVDEGNIFSEGRVSN